MKATAIFSVKKWDEKTSEKLSDTQKVTNAFVEYDFKGDLEGTGTAYSLMYYKQFDETDQHKSSAAYLGFIRFVGKLAGKDGSFVMEESGDYENSSANSKLKIIDGSATGELNNIKGSGFYTADKTGIKFELDYTL
ncbi:MAG: DUF3224 domain-containing protein [Ignavibacteriaceae bacterium]